MVSIDMAYGAAGWCEYIYVYQNKKWHLIYVGGANLGSTGFWDCAFYDYKKKTIIFQNADGKVLSKLYIGKELNLIKY